MAMFLGPIASLSAQNIAIENLPGPNASQASGLGQGSELRQLAPGVYEVPSVKAVSRPVETPGVYLTQDCLTLDERQARQSVESVVDLGVLRNPPAFQKAAASGNLGLAEKFAKDLQVGMALISAVYRPQGEPAAVGGCDSVALSVGQRVKLDPSMLLELVEREVAANESCACEIVKTAIAVSEADPELVASIAEVAIMASPQSMRMISQCAIAVVPEALGNVQALLARLDPGSGVSGYSSKYSDSSKSAKDAKGIIIAPPEKAAALPNPLDLPPTIPLWVPPIIPPEVTKGGFKP